MKSRKGKATSDMQVTSIQLTADLSAEILQARSEWQNIFKVLKEKNVQ